MGRRGQARTAGETYMGFNFFLTAPGQMEGASQPFSISSFPMVSDPLYPFSTLPWREGRDPEDDVMG